MPASTDLVSIDHAKDWAKRLHKSKLSVATLSSAQEAVAVMLGHASWHALDAFYKNAALPAAPSTNEAEAPLPITENPPPFDDMMQAALDALNRKFPGLNGTFVEVIAHETDELECNADELADKVRDFEDQGYFPESAMAQALEENTTTLKAPPGHLMIRVRDTQGQAYMTVISSEEYSVAFKAAAAGTPKRPKLG